MTDASDFIAITFRYLRSVEGRNIPRDHADWAAAFSGISTQRLAEALVWHARHIGSAATITSVRNALLKTSVPSGQISAYATLSAPPDRIEAILAIECPECDAPTAATCGAPPGQVHVSRWMGALWRVEPRQVDADDMFAAHFYGQGESPLAVTEKLIEIHMQMLLHVSAARATEPRAFPGVPELTPIGTARKILAAFLSCGWTHPGLDTTASDPGGDGAQPT